MRIATVIERTHAYLCLDCGVCTGSCPVARANGQFSPRMNVERTLAGLGGEVEMDREIWSCTTCGLCAQSCPSVVDYLRFIREARTRSMAGGHSAARKTHAGVFDSLERLQAHRDIEVRRPSWVEGDLRVADSGEWLYFVGCLPIFQGFFGGRNGDGIGEDLLDTARSAVRLLNAAGIVPAVRSDERCCGHDLLWTGDRRSFESLARANLDMIRRSGARHVVSTCPECVRTLKLDYAEVAGAPDIEVLHISEAVTRFAGSDRLPSVQGATKPEVAAVTYHDPCRLGRHLGIYAAPRDALRQVARVEVLEMARSRERAACCGTSCWMNCDGFSERMRLERLREAVATGAETMVVACPKCQLHFRCTLSNHPELGIKITELTGLLARRIVR